MVMFDLKVPLRERPEKVPDFSKVKGISNSLVIGGDLQKMYQFLREHPDEAFCGSEVKDRLDIKADIKHCGDTMRILSSKGYVFRIPLMVRSIGYQGAYLYSFSEKALWQRFWTREVPKDVMKVLSLIWNSQRQIFSMQDLIDDHGIKRKQLEIWFGLCFHRDWKKAFGRPLVERRRIEGVRTFFYRPSIPNDIFAKLYEQYYKERIISQKKLMVVKGTDFEDFSTWVFSQYMKLKGIDVQFERIDKEPLDYLGRVVIDIEDTVAKPYAKTRLELCKFVVSCKNYRLDRPIGSGYVMGMSGCLREGMTWRGEQIFSPRNSIGIIFCTRAYPSAFEMAGKLGIRIFDLEKIMRMYQAVVKGTGQENPLFDRLRMKVDAYREKVKGGNDALPAD